MESDDSFSEFKRNLRVLLPSLHSSSEGGPIENLQGTRKSKRHKKPSSRFNEETGFVAEPPRSTKKKGTSGESSKGTHVKPLLISDWSDAQIIQYCNDCGIDFSGNVNDCIMHIRSLE